MASRRISLLRLAFGCAFAMVSATLTTRAPGQIAEREFNDAPGFAQSLGTLSATGLRVDAAIDRTDDVDDYAFSLTESASVDLSARGRGANGLTGGTLYLYNRKGFMIASGIGWTSYFRDIHIELPAGNYVVGMQSRVTGDYRLDITFQKLTIPRLSLSGPSSASLTQDETLLSFDLPGEGVFSIQLDGKGIDTRLYLRSKLLTELFRVDTASTSTQKDAGLRAHLPKGSYYVTLRAQTPGPVSIQTSFVAKSLPILPCNGSLQDVIPGGQEDFLAYRFALTTPSDVELKITAGTTGKPLTDSYLLLLDDEFDEILENDDDSAKLGSIVSGTLPAANYFAVSTGFWGNGTFDIASTCGSPVTTPIVPGSTAAASVSKNDGHVTFVCAQGTETGVDFEFTRGTYLPYAQLMLVDGTTGLSRGWRQAYFAGLPYPQLGSRYPKGTTYAIVKGYSGDKGAVEVAARAPQLRDRTTTHLRAFGKSGHFAILVVSARTIPGFPVPGVTGSFQLDLAQGFIAFAGQLDIHGEFDFGFPFPVNSGAFVQSLLLDATTFTGEFTNVLN
ncbi:MAG: hypothetical protein KDC95_10355 [Planctomycetes bacterium]|nr:hypothetical protein [Planctomycetota bacterium]